MPHLEIHDIPEELHQRLHSYARENDCTISEFVITAIQRELERYEWRKRLAHRPKTDLDIPAAQLLAQERSSSIERLDEPLRS